MGLISKTVIIKWSNKLKNYYINLGYTFTNLGDEFEVKVGDLPNGSGVKVQYECDRCGEIIETTYNNYNKHVKDDGKIYCNKCATTLYGSKKSLESKIKKSGSFYDWCIENHRQDVLDRWDYELNNCSPKDISKNVKRKKYWFKCDKHPEHKSELKHISNFTSGEVGCMDCKQCLSFYQWCIDNNKKDFLDLWDYDKNECTPWDITCKNNKKYYFKCSKNPCHESELKNITQITNSGRIQRCKQCSSLLEWFKNNGLDINKYWDFDKNQEIDPSKIDYDDHKKKAWFVCQEKEYHGSYYIGCGEFTLGKRCPYCSINSGVTHPKDSIGQFIIDNYGEDFLHMIWSDKNKKTAFEYSMNNDNKVWWKCPDGKHEDFYKRIADARKCEFRCPKCVKESYESVIEKKTRLYLEELGHEVKTEHRCTIIPKNPKTNARMPFDNEIILSNGKHLIIEVHGEQHYSTSFYTSIGKLTEDEAQKAFEKRKLYDRYKKYIAWKNGYEYLEVPYYMYRGKMKNEYKQAIDNKISEILHCNNI